VISVPELLPMDALAGVVLRVNVNPLILSATLSGLT